MTLMSRFSVGTVVACAMTALLVNLAFSASAGATPLTGNPALDGWTFQGNTLQTVDPIYYRHTDGPGASVFTPDRVQDFDVYTRVFRLSDEIAADSTFQTNDVIIGLGFVLNDVAAEDEIAWSEGFFSVDFNQNSFSTSAPGSNHVIYGPALAAQVGDAGDVSGFIDANPNPGDSPAAFDVEQWNIIDGLGGVNAPYSPSSSDIPARTIVQTDIEPNIGAGRLGMTQGQFLINISAVNRARGTFAGQQEGVLGSDVTLRLGFLENYGAGAEAVVTIDATLPPLTNNDFSTGNLDGWTVTTEGAATVLPIDLGGGEFAAALTTGSPATLSQLTDTPGGPFDIIFDHQFLSDLGVLDVLFEGQILASIPAATMSNFATKIIRIDDPSLFSQFGELAFRMDGAPGNTVLIDNVSLVAVPTPEPTTAAMLVVAVAAMAIRRRRQLV